MLWTSTFSAHVVTYLITNSAWTSTSFHRVDFLTGRSKAKMFAQRQIVCILIEATCNRLRFEFHKFSSEGFFKTQSQGPHRPRSLNIKGQVRLISKTCASGEIQQYKTRTNFCKESILRRPMNECKKLTFKNSENVSNVGCGVRRSTQHWCSNALIQLIFYA